MAGTDDEQGSGATRGARSRARSPRRWEPLPTHSSAPTPFRDALDTLASTLGMTDVETINALLVDWPTIVGDHLARHCRPRSLRHGILTVEAADHQWAIELRWMTSLLIERCCEALGPDAVQSVRIVR